MRTAVLSDAKTVECVKDQRSKAILAAYIKSIYDPSTAEMNYIQRYYALASRGVFALEQPDHPIYKQPEVQAVFKGKFPELDVPRMRNGKKSGLPPVEIQQMLDAAQKCNAWRNAEYMLLSTEMMLGLTPVLTPFVARTFFKSPYAFYLSSLIIASAVLLLLWRRKHALPIIMAMCVGIYLSMVFVVALKQGGEDRYTDTVEPMFVLGVAIASAVLCSELMPQLTYCVGMRLKQAFRWLPSVIGR